MICPLPSLRVCRRGRASTGWGGCVLVPPWRGRDARRRSQESSIDTNHPSIDAPGIDQQSVRLLIRRKSIGRLCIHIESLGIAPGSI